jgi:hypothetical protein
MLQARHLELSQVGPHATFLRGVELWDGSQTFAVVFHRLLVSMQHNVSVAVAIRALPDVVLNEFYVNVAFIDFVRAWNYRFCVGEAFIDSCVVLSSLVTDRSGLIQQVVRGNGSFCHDGEGR